MKKEYRKYEMETYIVYYENKIHDFHAWGAEVQI